MSSYPSSIEPIDQVRHHAADRQTRRQAGRFDTGCLNQARVLPIAANHEIRKRLVRRMKLRTDPAS